MESLHESPDSKRCGRCAHAARAPSGIWGLRPDCHIKAHQGTTRRCLSPTMVKCTARVAPQRSVHSQRHVCRFYTEVILVRAPRARCYTGFIAVEQPRTHTPTCSAPHSALGRRHTHTHTVTHTPVTDVTEAHTVTDRGGRHSAASPITNITDVPDVPDVTDVAFHEETRHEQHLSERAGGARAATMTSSRDSGRTPGAPVI